MPPSQSASCCRPTHFGFGHFAAPRPPDPSADKQRGRLADAAVAPHEALQVRRAPGLALRAQRRHGQHGALLADEPTCDLDNAHRAEVMRILRELDAEGTTLVMVAHSLEHAVQASTTLRLLDGRVVVDAVAAVA